MDQILRFGFVLGPLILTPLAFSFFARSSSSVLKDSSDSFLSTLSLITDPSVLFLVLSVLFIGLYWLLSILFTRLPIFQSNDKLSFGTQFVWKLSQNITISWNDLKNEVIKNEVDVLWVDVDYVTTKGKVNVLYSFEITILHITKISKKFQIIIPAIYSKDLPSKSMLLKDFLILASGLPSFQGVFLSVSSNFSGDESLVVKEIDLAASANKIVSIALIAHNGSSVIRPSKTPVSYLHTWVGSHYSKIPTLPNILKNLKILYASGFLPYASFSEAGFVLPMTNETGGLEIIENSILIHHLVHRVTVVFDLGEFRESDDKKRKELVWESLEKVKSLDGHGVVVNSLKDVEFVHEWIELKVRLIEERESQLQTNLHEN
ncbi:hypothetical protein HK096_002896 [Nowakowskiella sp. JEL0078]|nr:hypothetical protein HK096_002896 [Nowakowskiella sp. JEL0078]